MSQVPAAAAAAAPASDDDDIKSPSPSLASSTVPPVAGLPFWDTVPSEEDPFTLLVQEKHNIDPAKTNNGTPDATTAEEEKKSSSSEESQAAMLKKPTSVRPRTVSWGSPTPLPSFGPSTGGSDLTLANVLGTSPELEAETYILQAIEKCANHRPVDTPEVSELYNTIAAEEIQKSEREQEEEEEDDEGEEEESDHDEFIVPPTTVTTDSPSRQVSHSTASTTERPSMSSSRQFSMMGHSSRQPSQGRFKALVSHKSMRSTTVEGRLHGLTSALTELDQHEHAFNPNKESGNDTDTVGIDTTTNFTAADKLVETTQKLRNKDGSNNSNPTSLDRGDIEIGAPSSNENNDKHYEHDRPHRKSSVRKSAKKVVKGASSGVREEWQLMSTYFATRKDKAKTLLRKVIVAVLIPSFTIAFFLFYVVENPELCLDDIDLGVNVFPTVVPSVAPNSSLAPSYNLSIEPTHQDAWWVSGFTVNETGNLTRAPTNTSEPTVAPTLQPSAMSTSAPSEIISQDNIPCEGLGASVSWWFLFLGVRLFITLMLAMVTQSLIVDYLALSSRILLQGVGPIITLFLVQAKGWPFVVTFWAIYSKVLLSGDTAYAHHWGWWQSFLGIFNEENPSGTVVINTIYIGILNNAVMVGLAVAGKRLVIGLLLSRQTFIHYSERLAAVMKNMVLLGEVATLARYIENAKEDYQQMDDAAFLFTSATSGGGGGSTNWTTKNIQALVSKQAAEIDAKANDGSELSGTAADAANAFVVANRRKTVVGVSQDPKNTSLQSVRSVAQDDTDPEFTASQQKEMAELLGAWEEPQTSEQKERRIVTIGALLQFRQALTFMKKKYPFLPAFGPAETRENCIESSQRVYERLLLRTPGKDEIPFETLALLAKNELGQINQEKAKELIRVFRPDRDGRLGKLEFVKSVDVIYKELRLLSANISNSSEMDVAVHSLVNVVFYIVLGAVIVYRFGEDPMALFLSFSGIFLAFAFLIGRSSAKYFDGCLFILVQRPYGVGDRVHLSDPSEDTCPDGSAGWIVEKVTLYSTHVYWGTTNERATLCNGAISNFRVINAARSPNATITVDLKCGINAQYEQIEIFKEAVQQYLKDRPREWLTFVSFRPSVVVVDKGYIGYSVVAQHRNAWQAIGGIIESKANLTTYCLEVSKQLGMRFLHPPLPVTLTLKDGFSSLPLSEGSSNVKGLEPSSSGDTGSNFSSAQEAMSALSSGLRRRKGSGRFTDIVRQVIDGNKDK